MTQNLVVSITLSYQVLLHFIFNTAIYFEIIWCNCLCDVFASLFVRICVEILLLCATYCVEKFFVRDCFSIVDTVQWWHKFWFLYTIFMLLVNEPSTNLYKCNRFIRAFLTFHALHTFSKYILLENTLSQNFCYYGLSLLPLWLCYAPRLTALSDHFNQWTSY